MQTVSVYIIAYNEAEKIEAFDLGADDYVNKPFGVGELMARMRTEGRAK